jgi:hypothetical protein
VTVQTSAASRRRPAAKLIASAAVLAAAAGVAGLATHGTFTDSTTPISTDVATGSVSIDVSRQGYAIPVTTAGFLPGDSMSRAVDLRNDGSSELSEVRLAVAATTSSLLDTDSKGLRLTVETCSEAWTQGGPAASPTYTCIGGMGLLYTGRAVMDDALPDVASLQPGEVDHLLLTFSLPSSAGNTLKDQTSTLSMVFTGTQRGGTAR